VPQRVRSDPLGAECRACAGCCGGVLVEAQLERACGQRLAAPGREQRLVRLPLAFAQTRAEDRDGLVGEDRAAVLVALADRASGSLVIGGQAGAELVCLRAQSVAAAVRIERNALGVSLGGEAAEYATTGASVEL
jgi:hypothetical protein